MQFAGQRTDLNLQPIGEPANLLVALPEDTLPSPRAIMVTGITPQATRQDGLSEREFCQFVLDEVATPGTTVVGYNSVRFDDEFMRALLWRNFHDPYEWQWKDGRSRWDLLDVVRLTRALRPEGINWPVTPEGRATNRLELITKENGIAHEHAHDALSDVEALISVTRLIKEKQPQLFDFLLGIRNKRAVAGIVDLAKPQPFVYASGRYPSEFGHTTVAYPIAPAKNGNALVFDLRYNLDELLEQEQAAPKRDVSKVPYPEREPWEKDYSPMVKVLQYNHCPAVAPLGVLSKGDGWQKLGLVEEQVKQNLASLKKHPEFVARMQKVIDAKPEWPPSVDAESALYDGFLNDHDRLLCQVVRSNGADDLADFHPDFADERLPELLLHYKAKQFPESLAADEVPKWEEYRAKRLNSQAPKFLKELEGIQSDLNQGKQFGDKSAADCEFLVQELMLWYQSLQDGNY